MNHDKCCYLVFGGFAEKRGVIIELMMKGSKLKRKAAEKDLGLLVDEKISREAF